MKVFVSSVVGGFEQYRTAARKAITLLGHTPVMCEDFGARPYSSQHACMTEVDQADAVVLILGANFGFETETGESVTQQEFRRAKAAGKPILAFLETVPMDERQQSFCREVSDYLDGLFRVTFSDQYALSDGIIQGLNQMAVNRKAISEQEFVQRLKQLTGSSRWSGYNHEARLEVAFLPQPETIGTLRAAHMQHEAFFLKVCQAGLGTLKGGYQDFDTAELTGIDTPEVKWRHHECGLCSLTVSLANTSTARNIIDSFYLSPTKVRKGAEAALTLLSEGKGGWFQIGLYGVGQKVFAEPPASAVSSISAPFRSAENLEERSLQIPATQGSLRNWLDDVMFRFERKMSL
ncbi:MULTISPECIES: DUF4062 domain-containing protein [Pseudomonas putida group]|uniref:DUF4062 domain-containing protein n=1 Tax=Pseudomonas putida group TaxID=136845 RepID=UPI0018A9E3DC|nr:DUF4062 domain-containing protein [Pseudomonas fulva]MBF8776310.1 DUF4062 domain-containing protein [Pseudomonas fulva]